MRMIIHKSANNTAECRRTLSFFSNARSAFKFYLKSLRIGPRGVILLPAYIGWSPKEGSGVFDPVRELGLRYEFYPLDNRLCVDFKALERILASGNVKLLVLIHYFGYVDPNYERIVRLCNRYGVKVLEDEAHSFYTDWVGGITGRLGDAAIFSVHKMLPFKSGGMLSLNNSRSGHIKGGSAPVSPSDVFSYDLAEIARRRRMNAETLASELGKHSGEVLPLRPNLLPGVVPQTYPVLICNVCRDTVYEYMNSAGYGVVSLYHTMIEQITKDKFPAAHHVSRQILNLPVHQDLDPSKIRPMVNTLVQGIKTLRKGGLLPI